MPTPGMANMHRESQTGIGLVLSNPGKDSCHSPIQPQHELELDLVMGRNPPPHPTATFKALPGDLVS